jgi:aspartyl-tRNA(Asn)/glutamyl-tRNA(Gln) amidotransferase subunit C
MAMLELPESERMSLMERFDKLADEFSALDKYDTSSAEPLVTVLNLYNIMREDIPEKFMQREDLLKNAPEHHDGYFQVPATIE